MRRATNSLAASGLRRKNAAALVAAAQRPDRVSAVVSRGGRPDLAEAGGKNPAALDAALDGAYGVVESLLG